MITAENTPQLDPVFLQYGMEVYSNEYIQELRGEILELKRKGKRSYNLIPQEGFQEKVLTTVADIKIIGGSRGGGKVLPNDADIITPFGIRKNGDLKIGDTISNPVTGGMEKVIAIYEHPNHDFYELLFDDGSSVECGLEHLWKVRQTNHRHKRRVLNGEGVEDDYRIWTFGMIKEWLDRQESGAYQCRGTKSHLVIPLTAPVKFTKSGNSMRKTNIDPYVIGALLGDGCLTEKATICYDAKLSGGDSQIAEEFEKAGISIASRVKNARFNCVDYNFKSELLRKSLEMCKLYGLSAKDKHIPTCYKWGTVEERFAIIQGLMDTDGTIDQQGKTISFCSISKQLAEDVQFVIRSLGGSAKITTKQPFYTNDKGERINGQLAYNVYIRIKDAQRLFRLDRKKARCTPYNGGVSEVARRIVGYRYIGKKDGRCITVDDVNSLYLTNDFIVTHNTFVSLFGCLDYAFNPEINLYGFRRLENDVKRGIYKSAKQVFKGFATFTDTSFEVKFFNGTGATMKMEHLQDLSKIKDRFRGAEMPYIVIEELAEFTKENLNVIFDLIASNRSTTGMPSQFICTCNPVGKSNKLRHLLDWWIDPETDTIIPERSGKVRYFCRYGEDVMEIAWGNTPEEVYANANARKKISSMTDDPDGEYQNYITSITFIEGDFVDNKILRATDPKYMNRISSGGSKSTINDIRGIWRDVEEGGSLLSISDMEGFFANSAQQRGRKVAAADIALRGDATVLIAADGFHIVDVDAVAGLSTEALIARILDFLRKNEVAIEDFTFDTNGIGNAIRSSEQLKGARPFDNRATARDKVEYRNLKSECLGIFIDLVQRGKLSIEPSLLQRKFRRHGDFITLREYLLIERLVAKWKVEDNPKEIIGKTEMKNILGGSSPDFLETLLYLVSILSEDKPKGMQHSGFNAFIRGYR